MELGFVTWDVSPEILHFGKLSIRYYGLFWSMGLLIGYYLLHRFARNEKFSPSIADKVALYAAIGVLIGARLGHCLIYDPKYYLLEHPIELFYFWEGGLASHGGGVGVLIALWILARQLRVPMLWIMDRISIPIALIATLIRLGNLMNSEIYGIETSRPWGFIFTRVGETVPHHPTQIYEAACYLLVFFLLLFLYYKRPIVREYRGLLFSVFLVLMFTARFMLEFVKEPQSAYEIGMPLNMGQILSIPFWVYGIILLIRELKRGAVGKLAIVLPKEIRKKK